MAKKKVAKKSTRQASTAKAAGQASTKKKKTPAKAGAATSSPTKSRKTATAPIAAKTKEKRTASRSTPGTTVKKTSSTTVRKESTSKSAPAAAKAPAKKSPGTVTRRGRAAAPAIPIAPDADGYVVINGRRVRMIASMPEPTTSRKKRIASPIAAPQETKSVPTKPRKTKLTKKQLDEYRAQLLRKRSELLGDLNAMEKQALQSTGGTLSHMPIHMADIGTDTYDQDFILGLAETERQGLREIDEALQRIEARTYGICQMTGKPIPKARLDAKPWAKYTIEAAREIERGLGE